MGLLPLYLIINIVFGAALYIMRSSQLTVAALIMLMTASGFVFARLSSISVTFQRDGIFRELIIADIY